MLTDDDRADVEYHTWVDDEITRETTDYLVRRGYVLDAGDPIIERLCWYVSPLDQWSVRIDPNRHNGAMEHGPYFTPDDAFTHAAQLRRDLTIGIAETPALPATVGGDWWNRHA